MDIEIVKRRIFSLVVLFFFVGFVPGMGWSQSSRSSDNEKELTPVLVDNFENSHYWRVEMPVDYGVFSVSRREGAPRGLKDTEGNKYVLGLRVSFFNGGSSVIQTSLFPPRPFAISGLVNKFRMWVVGRGTRSSLKVLVVDPEGIDRSVSMGNLDFLGWRQIEGAVPDTMRYEDVGKRSVRYPAVSAGESSPSSVVKEESKFFSGFYGQGPASSIIFKGILMEFNGAEAKGTYYAYFDNLEAMVDKSNEELMSSIDNMLDDW